jgi:hypothetical protein
LQRLIKDFGSEILEESVPMKITSVSCTVLALTIAGPANCVTPTFFARHDYMSGGNFVSVADTNGDGIPDIIGDPLRVFFGNGDGTFRQGPVSPTGMRFVFNSAAADVNGDGKVDVIFAGSNGVDGIGVCLGNGDGTFQPAVFYPASGGDDNDSNVVVGDFNNDGIPDIATVGTSGVWLFTGKGGGAFNPAVLVTYTGSGGDYYETLAAADFNGDKNLDLVVPTTTGFAVLLGNGNGTFRQETFTFPFPGPTVVTSIAIGDLNLDGHLDIVLRGFSTKHSPANLAYVYLGDGSGAFSGPTRVEMDGPWRIAIGDVNGDHIPDLVSSAGYIALGRGDGTFKPPYLEPVAYTGSFNVVLADLRHNGLTDVVTQAGTGVVSVLLNEGKGKFKEGEWFSVPGAFGCGAPADYNGDGKPDLAMGTPQGITVLLGTGNASAPFTTGPTLPLTFESCPIEGDFNGDGIPDLLVVNGSDILIYLGNGDGTFTYKSSTAISTFIGGLVLGDFNHDGKLDVALSSNWLLLGNGDGTFQAPAHFSPNPYTWSGIVSGDINGDGLPDLVLWNLDFTSIYIMLNNGQGGFNESSFEDPDDPYDIALVDLTGNGIMDMVVSGYLVGDAAIYLGNGEGGFTFKDKFGYPAEYFTQSVISMADVDGDGFPDLLVLNSGSLGIYLGKGNATFKPPFFIGPGDAPGMILTQTLHGQPAGLPDIVLPDGAGGVKVLINTTKIR